MVGRECGCNLELEDFRNSSIQCNGNQEIVFTTNVEYSTDDGTETASVIAERIIEEVPFFMIVQREELVVTSACTDCETLPDATYTTVYTEAESGFPIGGFGVGIFALGFLAAVLIIGIFLLIIL